MDETEKILKDKKLMKSIKKARKGTKSHPYKPLDIKRRAWLCIAICEGDLPNGADFPPRDAVDKALRKMDLKVIMLSTGWNIVNVGED